MRFDPDLAFDLLYDVCSGRVEEVEEACRVSGFSLMTYRTSLEASRELLNSYPLYSMDERDCLLGFVDPLCS